MKHFDAKQIQMRATKHLALEKFEPVDVSFCDAVTFRPRASGVHGGILPADAIGKTLQFGGLACFCSLQPPRQYLCLSLFKHAHKFLTQEIHGVKIRTRLAHVLDLLALFGGQLLG